MICSSSWALTLSVLDMRIVNIYLKDLYRILNSSTKLHVVFYNNPNFLDFIGKLSELSKYRLYNYVYDGVIDRIFFSQEEPDVLFVYVSVRE